MRLVVPGGVAADKRTSKRTSGWLGYRAEAGMLLQATIAESRLTSTRTPPPPPSVPVPGDERSACSSSDIRNLFSPLFHGRQRPSLRPKKAKNSVQDLKLKQRETNPRSLQGNLHKKLSRNVSTGAMSKEQREGLWLCPCLKTYRRHPARYTASRHGRTPTALIWQFKLQSH